MVTEPRRGSLRQVSRLLQARISGQAGLVTRSQLLVERWTDDEIKWRVRSGRWTQLHRGVYLTVPGRDDWEVRAVAAVLAVGSPSCLVGESAGQAWGLLPRTEAMNDPPAIEGAESEVGVGPGLVVHVAVPLGRSGAKLPGVTVKRLKHFTSRVHPTQWPHRTTVEHTVFDLSLGHCPDRFIALMAKACQLRLATEATLGSALTCRRRQPHRGLMLEALGLIGKGAESAAEVRYIRDVEMAHGLPTGKRQEPAPGSRSRDSEYPDFGLIVEIDGRLGHVGWANQQRAGRRDRKAAVTGRLTVRGGWTDVAVTPCEFAADLAAILQVKGWRGQPTSCGKQRCDLATRAA
jgi:hypothetical protein